MSSDASRLVKAPGPVSVSHHAVVMPPSLQRHSDGLAEQVLSDLMERLPSSPASASWSCQAYDRLLARERVSWSQILREHPLLGSITVTKLVEAGVVQVTPIDDPMTGTTDVWLTMHSRFRAGGQWTTADASRDPRRLPITDADGGRRPAPNLEGSRREVRALGH